MHPRRNFKPSTENKHMKFFFLVHWPGWRHPMPDTHLKTTNTGVPMESSMALQQRALEWSQTATHRQQMVMFSRWSCSADGNVQQMVMFSRWSCSLVLPWGPGLCLCHDHESHHHYWCNVDKFTSIMMMMSWCLMSSDVIWHIRDKLWPMPKHGSIKSTYIRCMRV